MTERSPGVWWLPAYAGRSSKGKPLQVSRAVHGGKRLAQAELAKLVAEVAERAGQAKPLSRGMTVTELLDRWLEYLTPLREPGTIRGYRQGDHGRPRFGPGLEAERPAAGPCLPDLVGARPRRPDGAATARHHEQRSAPGPALGTDCPSRHGPGFAAGDPQPTSARHRSRPRR